ncbi:MAG: holo-[acyl-carrier-protein] synthase [Acidobacteria bacterium]|nr:MAG: holo-[acyl-carrier-protein] synthase [Acidobacteriota bacterium]
MILGLGVDHVEVPRFEQVLKRHGERLLRRLFTPNEIAYCQSKARAVEHFAARFAAKEAALKALGTGKSGGIGWRDVEITRQPGHPPQVIFHGKAKERFQALGARRALVSLTHTSHSAIAEVIIED